MKTLKSLKRKYLFIKNLKKADVQDQIDLIVLKTMQSEMEILLLDSDMPEFDIDAISTKNLVISDDDIFKKIQEDMLEEVFSEIEELRKKACREVNYKINVIVDNFKFVYEYENFRNKSPQKVYNHYLKRKNIVRSWSQRMVKKPTEVFLKQKEILRKFVNNNIKKSTATILRNYNFIDNGFRVLLDKLYFSTTSTDFVPLYYGIEIRYGLNWLKIK